jgi:hypothetical protein
VPGFGRAPRQEKLDNPNRRNPDMNILVRILRSLGFTGKTLDKAIKQMTKLDAYLETVEAQEKEAAQKLEAQAKAALEASTAATNNAERAARIRERAKEFIA